MRYQTLPWLLPYIEAVGNFIVRDRRQLRHGFDYRARRPLGKRGLQLLQRIRLASRRDFHRSAGRVHCPAVNAEPARLLPREPAKPDALNAPGYLKV